MSRPADRFGIGSLAAYDELISPMVAQAQLLGTADYLQDVNARQAQQQAQSVQDPVAARFMTPDVPTLEEEFKARRDTYSGILGDPEQQRNMTQAQMLFDIANTALAFSTAGSRPGMSPAERLAEAAVETKLFPTIAARSAAQQEQQQKFDLAALQSAETSVAAKQKAAAEYAKTLAGQEPEYMRVKMQDGSTRVFNVSNPMGRRSFEFASGQPGAQVFKVGTETTAETKSPDYMSVLNADGSTVGVYNVNDPTQRTAFEKASERVLPLGGQVGDVGTVSAPDVLSDTDYFSKFGMTKTQFDQLPAQDQRFLLDLPVVTDEDFFGKFGMTQQQFNALPNEEKRVLQGLPTLTDDDYFSKFGMPKADFLALDPDVRNRLTGVEVEPKIRSINGQLVDVTNPDNPQVIFGEAAQPTPKLVQVTIDETTSTVDVNTEAGRQLLDKANQLNAQTPGRARVNSVSSQPSPRGFLIDGKIRTSFDDGRTYVDNGQIKSVPDDAFEVSNTTSYEVYKSENAKARAGKQLEELDAQLLANMSKSGAFDPADIQATRKATQMAIDGTGFYPGLTALLDNVSSVIPGPLKPEFIENFGTETQEAKQFLRGLTVLGRSALVVNNRFPVAEMQNVATLFPDPDAFFVDPITQANKLVSLKRTATKQLRRNLAVLKEGGLDSSQAESIRANNFEIERLLSLMPGVNIQGGTQGASAETVDALRQSLVR